MLRQAVEKILRQVVSETGSGAFATGASFQEMGLDSLGSVELSHMLSEAIGRAVPATLAYSHPTVEAACDFLLELMGWPASARAASTNPSAARAGEEPKELRLDEFLNRADLALAGSPVVARDPRRGAEFVFLTGANGFTGRFLALEILQRLPPGGRLYCLVRAGDDATALTRLRDAYGADPEFRRFLDRQLQNDRLIVLAGDVTQPQFGLPEATYERLGKQVDCIVHNAAVVDHVLGYRELFAPNVLGTVEIVRFALAGQRKVVNYVSTIATQRRDGRGSTREQATPAAGYTATKAASESLLKELHDRFDVPVRIYRPSYIMAHSKAPGQINPQDTLTRLLHGIVTTSLAPGSFYGEGRSAKGGAYDGLPVDTIARSIAALSLAGQIDRPGYVEYNIVNPHGDVGLDDIAAWVKSAGFSVQRVDDYGAWYKAFKRRLGSLNRQQRQQSLLPLLHTWERPRAGAQANHDMAAYRRDMARNLQAEGTQPPTDAPRITEQFIHKCLKDMQLIGLIGAPGP
jgi:fatty acid CoA ligase FadD9